MKKVALHNLGCKVNAYETEAMQEILEQNGYEIVPFEEKADAYIVNTCSVTNMADKKSRQMLHRAKKMNPEAVVIAAGCYVQSAGEELLKDTSVDILIGNNEKVNLPSILENWEKEHKPLHVHDLTREHTYEELTLSHTAGHTRAFMKIQDGCNQFCTYCIIPYTRGRVRSRRLSDIVAEAGRLAENGYQEVVLTGIHLDSYGTDLEEHENLLTVIQEIAKIDGIKRIRLGSLEPRIITEEFVRSLGGLPKLCHHFHLSLQSGCDAVLRRMNRHYTTEDYAGRCRILRQQFPDAAITTDVIVGFPGETEEEFEATKTFVADVRFYEMHVFKYSKRAGTKAAAMPDQIPEQVKAARSAALLELEAAMSREYRKRFTGRKVSVLFEEPEEIGGRMYMTGYTPEYVKAALDLEAAGISLEKAADRLGGNVISMTAGELIRDDLLKVF